MTNILLWLASDDGNNLDLSDKEACYVVSTKAFEYPENLASITETTLFDGEFFHILEEGYMCHLKLAIISFGREEIMKDVSPSSYIIDVEEQDEDLAAPPLQEPNKVKILWSDAYSSYIDFVQRRLGSWV